MPSQIVRVGLPARVLRKACPQCGNLRDDFSPNVYTQDGLNLCCDKCYERVSLVFSHGVITKASPQLKETFEKFRDFQIDLLLADNVVLDD